MPNDYFNNVPGSMYNNLYGQQYNPSGAAFSYPGVSNYQPRPYGSYMNSLGQQNGPALNGQPTQPQQPNMTNVNWIYVPNIEAAKNVSIMPSQTLYIMNQNKNEFYLKTSNEMGVSSLKVCPFSVFDAAEYEQKSQIEQAQSVAGEFVGRDEFNNFAQNVSQQFAALQQGIIPPVQQPPVQPMIQQQALQASTQEAPQEQTVLQPQTTTKRKDKKND